MPRSRLLANRPLVAVVVGAVAIVGLVVVFGDHARQLMDRRAAVDGLVHSVTYDTAKSHLWLEQHLAGADDPTQPAVIDQRLADALGACTILRTGGLVAGQRVEPLAMAAQSSVGALCDRLVTLQELTSLRMADPGAHSAGSALHQDYDAAFLQAVALAERVQIAVDELVQARRVGLVRLFAALVAAVVVTFGLMAATVSRHARQLRQASRRQGESEAWFRTLVHAASDLIVVLDRSGTLVYANPVAEDALGFSPAQEAGRDLFEHVHPDDRERTAEEFAQWVRRPGAAHPWAFRFASAEDGWRTFEAVWTNCLDDPAVAGVVVNARDITATQQSRDALRASEASLREAQRLARLGNFDMVLATQVVVWSDELHRIFGTDPEDFEPAYDSFLAAVHEEDRNGVEVAVTEAVANNVEYAGEFRILRPDGGVRMLRTRAVVVTGEEPDSARLVGTAQDVTDELELHRDLDARVRELTCLAAVRRAVQEMGEAADVCAAAASALAPAMSHPQLAVATVDFDGRTDGNTGDIAQTSQQLTAAVVIDGTERGQVRVGYTCAAAAFRPEEEDLVESVATTLAHGLERHESQAALAESQARFRRLVDNIPDVVFRYRLGDDEGIDYVSPSVEGLTGYRAQDFLDDPQLVRRILVGSDAAMEPNSAQNPPGDGGTGGAVQLVARDGSVRWLEYNIVLVHDAVGSVMTVEGVARDVTKRTAAELALEQRAREHAALARFGQAALTTDALVDLYGLAAAVITETLPVDAVGVSELHPGTGELVLSLGVGWPSGIIGQTRMPIDTGSLGADTIAQDSPVIVADLAQHTTPDAPFLTGHGMVSGMSVVIGGRGGPHGALGAFSTTAQAYAESQIRFLETVAHVLGAAIERTTAQAELARSEQEFRTLAEQMPDIVARYGRDHRYRYLNPPVTAVAGMSPADMLGKTNRELGLSSPFVAAWEDAHDRVFASAEPTTVEGDYPGVAGTIHLHSLIIPEFDSAGTVRAAISVTRDITELHRAEAQRREDLARIVAAQETERGRIGEDIHDDSIQVMAAVGMRLEVLKCQMTDPETLAQVARLEETVRHAIDRLRSLMFELRPPELDRDGICPALRLYLQTTATDALPAWELTDHATLELPTEMRVVLYRITVEAIANARKHARASLLTITLDDIDGGVRLRVGDDGQGFDTADLDDVGPHHVGIATMRGRAGAAQGTVDIHSTPGQGTVVSAWLPCPAGAPLA